MTEQPKSYMYLDRHRIWYLPSKGKYYLHRLDGPAYDGAHGEKVWYIDNNYIPPRDIEPWLKENNMTAPYSEEDQMAIMLRWA